MANPCSLRCYRSRFKSEKYIFYRRRDLINDRPNCATIAAAEAPLDEAQERYYFDSPTTHTRGAYQHGEAA